MPREPGGHYVLHYGTRVRIAIATGLKPDGRSTPGSVP